MLKRMMNDRVAAALCAALVALAGCEARSRKASPSAETASAAPKARTAAADEQPRGGVAVAAVSEAPEAESPSATAQPVAVQKRTVDRDAEPLRIAFISYANPQTVARDIEPTVAYLEPRVGVPIRGFVTLDYGSSIESMRSKQTDLAFVDPLAFMMAHEQIGAEPLLLEIYGSGKPRYHSCIWVRKDSRIKTLEDLKGKTIAFADQIDMSGHLLPRDIFERKGLLPNNQPEEFFKQVYFSGGDEQAMRAVLNKFVDAAGVSQYANLLLRLEERDDVVALATSIESPSHLLMARQGLSAEIVARVKKALLALDSSVAEDKKILDRLYGVRGYAEASLGDFAEVAQVAARFGFVKQPKLFASKTSEEGAE